MRRCIRQVRNRKGIHQLRTNTHLVVASGIGKRKMRRAIVLPMREGVDFEPLLGLLAKD